MKQISSLYTHTAFVHKPRNVNDVHADEKARAGFNQRVAIGMTDVFQSMVTFWLILAWLALWIVCSLVVPHYFDPLPWTLMLTLASVPQLPLMVVIMVGQGLLGRKQELMAEEQYATTGKSYHDIEQLIEHMNAQDEQIVKLCQESQQQTKILAYLQKRAMGEV